MDGEFTLKLFWQAGGFGMYMVAAFGLTSMIHGLRFAIRPDERELPFARAMSTATLLTIVFSVVSDFAAVCWSVSRLSSKPEDWAKSLLIGTFESLTPAIMGFGVLSLVWLAHAIGLRRLARALP